MFNCQNIQDLYQVIHGIFACLLPSNYENYQAKQNKIKLTTLNKILDKMEEFLSALSKDTNSSYTVKENFHYRSDN